MQFRYVLAAAWIGFGVPIATLSAQDTLGVSPKWSVSLGVDPTHLDLSTRDPGVDARMVANLTRSWQSANSRFGRNISLMFGMDAPRQFNPGSDPQCCWIAVKRRYTGLTAGLSYDLPSISRFTPYLKGGAGVYYIQSRTEPAAGFLTTAELGYYPPGFGRNSFSMGANGGLGLKMKFGSREFFIEQMLHMLDVWGTGIYPLNFGLRF